MSRQGEQRSTQATAGSLIAAAATATAVAAAISLAAPALASPARAAAAAALGWRVIASFPFGSSVDELAASGPDSAWAVESCTKPCASTDGLIAFYNLRDGKIRASAVQWTGKSWGPATLFHPGTAFTSVVAASPAAVWAFGSVNEFTGPYAARYDGKAWSKAPMPGGTLSSVIASARSPSDIWALGISAGSFGLAISRWNGERWARDFVPAPKAALEVTGGGQTRGVILKYGA
ncbi:MAG TPA: hypothetical protein VMI73_29070 [Trebonia sp.]|nr:hypothetical protein [Trebonia sp.]